jgi:hypothetical protein
MHPAGRPPVLRATFPRGRCAGCDWALTAADQPVEGRFPLPARESLLLIRFRLCARCLAEPELRDEGGLQRHARALATRLWRWYSGNPVAWPCLVCTPRGLISGGTDSPRRVGSRKPIVGKCYRGCVRMPAATPLITFYATVPAGGLTASMPAVPVLLSAASFAPRVDRGALDP